MARSKEYVQAYRAASEDAITHLRTEAARMDDPQAMRTLDTAIFRLAVYLKIRATAMDPDAKPS